MSFVVVNSNIILICQFKFTHSIAIPISSIKIFLIRLSYIQENCIYSTLPFAFNFVVKIIIPSIVIVAIFNCFLFFNFQSIIIEDRIIIATRIGMCNGFIFGKKGCSIWSIALSVFTVGVVKNGKSSLSTAVIYH